MNAEATERTLRAEEQLMQDVLPGLLPSGWNKLTHKLIVWRDDGGASSAYAGHGLKVIVERPPGTFVDGVRRRYVVQVTRVNGDPPTELDLDRVRDLFARVRRARRMKDMLFTQHGPVAKHIFIV